MKKEVKWDVVTGTGSSIFNVVDTNGVKVAGIFGDTIEEAYKKALLVSAAPKLLDSLRRLANRLENEPGFRTMVLDIYNMVEMIDTNDYKY